MRVGRGWRQKDRTCRLPAGRRLRMVYVGFRQRLPRKPESTMKSNVTMI
jgi:hypothetical protein